MGDPGAAGKPAYPSRYRNFLYACGLVSAKQHQDELIRAFGGTTTEGSGSGRKGSSRR